MAVAPSPHVGGRRFESGQPHPLPAWGRPLSDYRTGIQAAPVPGYFRRRNPGCCTQALRKSAEPYAASHGSVTVATMPGRPATMGTWSSRSSTLATPPIKSMTAAVSRAVTTWSTGLLQKATMSTAWVGVKPIRGSWSTSSACSASKTASSPTPGPTRETRTGRRPSSPQVSVTPRLSALMCTSYSPSRVSSQRTDERTRNSWIRRIAAREGASANSITNTGPLMARRVARWDRHPQWITQRAYLSKPGPGRKPSVARLPRSVGVLHRSDPEENLLLQRDRGVEDVTEAGDVPAPLPPFRNVVPQLCDFRRLSHHLVQGFDSERPEVSRKLWQRLRRTVVRTRGAAARLLRDDQGCCGNGSLSVKGLQKIRDIGSTLEDAADHGLALFQRCLVQVAGEVGGGVVVEGAYVPGAHVISSRSIPGILAATTDSRVRVVPAAHGRRRVVCGR
ncbi:hypothetical protein SBRY_50093 [Actinacidiphila bryophytorum]|uniref:Uncharacterized protein n=1 Tax=Actinacidiphila bryophytorum TaxID=1436133 RepID=A0A9W4MCP1_9ACTN|nr:hypothetical protein SBRY_50093 [Actinacidiphila bryophytorum]